MRPESNFTSGLAVISLCASLAVTGVAAAQGPASAAAQPAGLSRAVPVPALPDSSLRNEPPAPVSESALAIRQILDRPPQGGLETTQGRRLWKEVQRFYMGRGWEPAWVGKDGSAPLSAQLFATARHAESDGLEPSQYPVPDLETALAARNVDPERRAELDVRLTHLFMTLGRHLAFGRLNPRDLETEEWYLRRPTVDFSAVLASALVSADVAGALEGLAPQDSGYAALREGLRRLRQVAAAGGWPRVAGKFVAARGDTQTALETVRAYLRATGDYPAGPDWNPDVMDGILEAAVRSFQKHHGLAVDGVLGPRTLAEMAVPVGDRIRTVLVNLERRRWFPGVSEREVLVNVPEYMLRLYDHGNPVHRMRVIAGAKDTPTPTFTDQITYMETNPPWHVPRSIASAEILPKILADPAYLATENFAVIDSAGKVVNPDSVQWAGMQPETLAYRFRQEPGAGNPLGSIKFIFPNQFSIYLHDTPNDRPFALADRALSHGCVRIEHPLSFASYLLRDDPHWSGERVAQVVKSGERKWIYLKEPMPITMVYFTAFVGEDGALNFRKDVYGRDAKLAEALAAYVTPRLQVGSFTADLTRSPR